MKKSAIYVVVLLIVVVIAAVLSIRVFLGDGSPDDVAPTPGQQLYTTAPAASPTPAESGTPAPTETPTPTETPVFETREPIEIAEPTPSQTPVPVDASGSFASDTGTHLNLLVDWTAYTDGSGSAKLQIDLSVSSYSFYTNALYNSIEVSVNGETLTASSPSVSYDGQEPAITPLASFTVDAPTGSASISAVWRYKGSYSGVELEELTASGTAYLG